MTFSTAPYQRSHGKTPRGRGSWAFCPFHLRNANDYLDYTLFSPSMTYAEAKRWAAAKIQELRDTAPLSSPYMSELWAVMP